MKGLFAGLALALLACRGEPTAGGAHSGDFVTLPGGFVAFVPSGRTINPLTKSNWEGTGVKPDVAASSARAQEKAKRLSRCRR